MNAYPRTNDPNWDLDERWPTQRLWIGWALVFFFVFEVMIGRRLPPLIAYGALCLGAAALASAGNVIRKLRSAARGE